MENKIILKGYRPIIGFDNYFMNKYGDILKLEKTITKSKIIIETKHTKVYSYDTIDKNNKPYNRTVVILNKKYIRFVEAFARAFIPNPNNYKYALLKDDTKGVSIDNVKWYKAPNNKSIIKVNVYLAKNFANVNDIEYCDKILLKKYDDVEVLCKTLGICRLTYTRNVNKKIFKPRKLHTYIYIEAIYGKENI